VGGVGGDFAKEEEEEEEGLKRRGSWGVGWGLEYYGGFSCFCFLLGSGRLHWSIGCVVRKLPTNNLRKNYALIYTRKAGKVPWRYRKWRVVEPVASENS